MRAKREIAQEIIDEIEGHLRLGNRVLARNRLDQILDGSIKISRNLYPKYAELLRRAGMAPQALKLLFRFVRGKGRNFRPASLQEKEQYAAALISVKATEEAFLLLDDLKKQNSAMTFLFLGMAHINRWDYESASVELKHYLTFKTISPYDRFVGITNLMASRVFLASQNQEETLALESEINTYLQQAREMNYQVLYANLLEIKSQLIVKAFHPQKAEKILAEASSIIADSRSKENLFVRKWNLISQKPSGSGDAHLVKKWSSEMENLRKSAELIQHIETIRDIDFRLGEFHPDILNKVFFGTPHRAFRKKITETYSFTPPSSFWFQLQPHRTKFQFDYLEYKDLKVGSVILKVMKALTSDFYRRQNKFTLFELVFPNDYFNPSSSFNKIHQALKRTRDWLQAKKIPLEIREENEEYFFDGDVEIKIYLNDRLRTANQNKNEHLYHEIGLLEEHFHQDFFSLTEAMLYLNHLNPRKTQRLIKKALEVSLLEKWGTGKKTLYQLKKENL